MGKTGAMLIGGLGHIAATVAVGRALIEQGLCRPTGMVSNLPELERLDLVDTGSLILGGWDIRSGTPLESARRYFSSHPVLDPGLLSLIEAQLQATSIYPGTAVNCGGTIKALAEPTCTVAASSLEESVHKLRADIRRFKSEHAVDVVIVVNLASTEPPLAVDWSGIGPSGLERILAEDRSDQVRASTLYAYAAIKERCPFINFTPSNAALIPPLIELAKRLRVPVMGNDGKTGETLLKSALAPMFSMRNLEILSWEGLNILGNLDGKVLNDPANKQSKIESKDRILPSMLGYRPHTAVHIHYVPSLDDQKTAWDFIHFAGFLGARMTLQFTWQGYDSILAAPLVLDLIRLAELALRRGESGVMPHLASFFKAPLGTQENRLKQQFDLLLEYAQRAGDHHVRQQNVA